MTDDEAKAILAHDTFAPMRTADQASGSLLALLHRVDPSKFRLMSYWRQNDRIWQADYTDDTGLGFGDTPEQAVEALLASAKEGSP